MIVGNIINCGDEINPKYFNCLTMDEFMVIGALKDKRCELPTLIVGWNMVKENFGDVSILSKMIFPPTDDGWGGCYWTFSPEEKRGIYTEDLKKFKERCYTDIVKNIKTYNIDPIIYKLDTTNDLIEKVKNLSGGIGYLFQERIVYIYKEPNIYMLDLELIDFIDFDRDMVVKVLRDNLSVFGDDLEEKFTEELKHLDIKYIPYLEFKNAT